MHLQALVPQTEIEALVADLLPLKVLLGDEDDDRTLSLLEPSAPEFLPGQGLRLGCRAEVRWSVLGVAVPITLRALSVVLSPRIAEREGGPALVFGLSIERADTAGLPARVDAKLVEKVNQALSARQVELAWGFGKTLSHTFALPAMLASLKSLNLTVGESSVEVLPHALRLSLELRAGVTRK
jgi:hypothetical protein